MTSIRPTLPPLPPGATEDPHATSKHTLCGYGWGDVSAALVKSIGGADMIRSQRWAAELLCSELGLGRLEALMYHSWALHVGPNLPAWTRLWYNTIHQLRMFWTKSNGDIKSVRNTPVIRQLVAEAVAQLVLATKRPLPKLPTSADCYREAEAMRARLRTGGGAGDQISTRRVWSAMHDGSDLRTIGNEFEHALRSNQQGRMLFWIIWLITLDSQPDAPFGKERGPTHLTKKQQKSLVWFLVDILRDVANEIIYLSVEERNGMFGCLELTWTKLGVRGRRDCICAIAISIQEFMQRKASLTIHAPVAVPSHEAVRNAVSAIDSTYSTIAIEARRFVLEAPSMVGLTDGPQRKTGSDNKSGNPIISSIDKLALVYNLAGSGGR
jgi:hypothetical protein